MGRGKLQGMARLRKTWRHSCDGLVSAFVSEAAFRQLLVLHAILLLLCLWLPFTALERALLMSLSVLSLVVELINSALEATLDRISLEYHPLTKNAKDMGSAAQSLMLLVIALVWLVLLF